MKTVCFLFSRTNGVQLLKFFKKLTKKWFNFTHWSVSFCPRLLPLPCLWPDWRQSTHTKTFMSLSIKHTASSCLAFLMHLVSHVLAAYGAGAAVQGCWQKAAHTQTPTNPHIICCRVTWGSHKTSWFPFLALTLRLFTVCFTFSCDRVGKKMIQIWKLSYCCQRSQIRGHQWFKWHVKLMCVEAFIRTLII